MAKRKAEEVLNVRVDFGNIGIGDETARVGIRIDRENLDVNRADEVFCGRRLTGKIITVRDGDAPEQRELIDTGSQHELKGVFDVKQFSANRKRISTGLTFSLAEIDVSEIGHFAKRSGRLIVTSAEELPDGHDEENHDGD
jgi:hypothetical protein